MTEIQVYALIALALLVGLTYWSGYRHGLGDGLGDGRAEGYSEGYDVGGCVGFSDGLEEGKSIQRSDSWREIRDLELLLGQARENHDKLYVHYQRALQASKLGSDDRDTLLATAKQLQLAADTFKALKASNQQATTLSLQTKVLAVAALLEQVKQEQAA